MMHPRLSKDAGFDFLPSEMTVRDITTWLELRTADRDAPFYAAKYYKPGKTAGQLDFKPPRTPIQVALVISSGSWEQREETLLEAESEDLTDCNNPIDRKKQRHPEKRKQSRHQPRKDASEASVSVSLSCVSATVDSSVGEFTIEDKPGILRKRAEFPTLVHVPVPAPVSPSKVGELAPASWSHDENSSVSNSPSSETPQTPTQSISRKRSHPGYRSPDEADFARLRKSLSIGDVPTCERVMFFCVIPRSMEALFASAAMKFSCDPAWSESGTLTVILSVSLGHGSFKDAHEGFLTLHRPPIEGISSLANQRVASKRVIDTSRRAENTELKRYKPALELQHSVCEANLLLWATSLLDLSYAFIEARIKRDGPPRLR
ncbi:unnamed protein product [Mycena citricolor]|uniref:Uncharacterized protein n=1 Tax=Mycena citricolor TaxID=2018698 RepID=A0AAD2HZA3_9AGAR|nr:unnamed protein product [Mycena citricolor]